jgi:hypothetical protein
LLYKCLYADAGRALPAVAEAHGDRVAFAQETADNADEQGFVPGSDVALGVVLRLQHGVVRSVHRGVIGRPRIAPLRPAHVAGEAVHDFDRAGVVDAEISCRIDQGEGLKTARFDWAGWRDHRCAHALGQIDRMRHVAPSLGL